MRGKVLYSYNVVFADYSQTSGGNFGKALQGDSVESAWDGVLLLDQCIGRWQNRGQGQVLVRVT